MCLKSSAIEGSALHVNSITNICWIRRDLRLEDHVALSRALRDGKTLIVFIFDIVILDKLMDKSDQRVSFIYDSLKELEEKLLSMGSSIYISYGDPASLIPQIAQQWKATAVYTNRDYEPYAKERDLKVEASLKSKGIAFHQFRDSVIFEKHEVLTKSNTTFKVFTPYKNRWIEIFERTDKEHEHYSCKLTHLVRWENPESIIYKNWYQEIGFIPTRPTLPAGRNEALKRVKKLKNSLEHYHHERNFPAIDGTSLLSVYIRHGNISIREVVKLARLKTDQGHRTFLSEIVWRDFYQMILDVYPRVVKTSFKPQYDKIKYLGTEEDFHHWCQGETGFPLVDAAMRCLNQTGLMHNRLRMLCASFLCKTLLVDWRKGESFFAQKLLDFDLAANNGGWQWSSSSGCDAQPYFRIFNPYSQSEKFDPGGNFIRMWVPELRDLTGKDIHHPSNLTAPDYPAPIVNYTINRNRCLKMYEVIKNE